MFTCYYCAKTINGEVFRTGVCDSAYRTGWNPKTKKSVNLDFPKAFHPSCYEKSELEAAKLLSMA